MPGRPEESTYLWGGGDQYVGYGFGVNVDYHFSRYLAAHFDITRTVLSRPVAYAGGYSDGWWIESVSDFTVERVGPFTEDVNYWRNATGIRVGLKAYLMRTDLVAAWAGVYQGFYTWEITMLSLDRSQQYGTTTGTATGPSLLNLGVDFWNRTRTLGMTVSLESGSPLTGDYAIENCLVNGWTYQSVGGEHVLGPRRLGVSLNFVSPRTD